MASIVFPLVSRILVPILGEVRVLLVRVCVPARLTKVSVPEGMVTVPPLVMEEILGVVKEGDVARTTEPEPVEVLPRTVTVPEASGMVHVLSAVGSVTVRSPSLLSAPPVAPSKMIPVEANSDSDADKAGLPAKVAV